MSKISIYKSALMLPCRWGFFCWDMCERISIENVFIKAKYYYWKKNVLDSLQRRIQDFPEVGAPTPQGRRQHTILPNFPKNCMKLKEFGPPWGVYPYCPPLDPPLVWIVATNKSMLCCKNRQTLHVCKVKTTIAHSGSFCSVLGLTVRA